jgi:PPOX class probable F420-dependent enzyme
MASRKRPLLDTTTPSGKRAQKRLEKEIIVWLASVGPDGSPHAVPVWFWWDGNSFLIYSVPGQKVKDIEANPNVALHLNTTPDGGDVLRVHGSAKRLRRQPPADKVPGYIRKYAALIKSYGWKPEGFSHDYHIALRVTPTRFRIS